MKNGTDDSVLGSAQKFKEEALVPMKVCIYFNIVKIDNIRSLFLDLFKQISPVAIHFLKNEILPNCKFNLCCKSFGGIVLYK